MRGWQSTMNENILEAFADRAAKNLIPHIALLAILSGFLYLDDEDVFGQRSKGPHVSFTIIIIHHCGNNHQPDWENAFTVETDGEGVFNRNYWLKVGSVLLPIIALASSMAI